MFRTLRRFALGGLVTFAVATLMTSATLAAAPTRTAEAVHISTTFAAGVRCAFEVVRTIDGTLVTTTFTSSDGLTKTTFSYKDGKIGYLNPDNGNLEERRRRHGDGGAGALGELGEARDLVGVGGEVLRHRPRLRLALRAGERQDGRVDGEVLGVVADAHGTPTTARPRSCRSDRRLAVSMSRPTTPRATSAATASGPG